MAITYGSVSTVDFRQSHNTSAKPKTIDKWNILDILRIMTHHVVAYKFKD
jgi:hypothetical protein